MPRKRIHLSGDAPAPVRYKKRPNCKGLGQCKLYGVGERHNVRETIPLRGYPKDKRLYIGPKGGVYTINNGKRYYPKMMNSGWKNRPVKPTSVYSRRNNRRLLKKLRDAPPSPGY